MSLIQRWWLVNSSAPLPTAMASMGNSSYVGLWHNPDLRLAATERRLTGGFRTPDLMAFDGTTLGVSRRVSDESYRSRRHAVGGVLWPSLPAVRWELGLSVSPTSEDG